MHLTVTTVERTVFESDTVTHVVLPTADGEITILPDHVPLMSVLGLGEIIIHQKDEEPIYLFVDGGLIQFDKNRLELLANVAERAEEMDEAMIEEARRRAEKLLEEKPIDVDLAKVEASLQRELMKQKLVSRRKRS